MKNSVGVKLVRSFLIIILSTVLIIGVLLVLGFQDFYYSSLENELTSRLLVTVQSFENFYSENDINDLVLEDSQLIWAANDAEIQLLNPDGYVIYDSEGALPTEPIETPDVVAARNNNITAFVGITSSSSDKVMAVTGRLSNNVNGTLGYLRYIASMQNTNEAMVQTSLIILGLGIVVVAITTIMALILAKSIVSPVEELISVAKKMANGQYKVRATLDTDDEFGQLGSTMNAMAEEVLKREEIKNDFISSISHELRTPLTSIKGWAVVLKSAKPEEQELVADGLKIIENETDRLSKMVEELLDFSRFISGRIRLEKDTINLTDILKDIAKQMRPRAELNKVEFISGLSDGKAMMVADENRLRQLFINLLDNAIKFTSEDGFVKFSSAIESDHIEVLVTDNGLGIDKDDLLHVKEKFYKGKHSKSHSGIGLSIVDEITKLHEGHLEIYSEKNIGTTVRVTLSLLKEAQNEETN
ncbi:ATP-binding protein [Peptoniphilus equinus]|uniref:histidine kinase n=1 Tax=Peptoniphilus equinus TaxID=3016343 RepID=A0ABY7QR38_9FIRM|nr:sensor histidine kinase [Peptoniphilus equinus]WBW49242.1 ATP-binding protein [Peptoniphilus equinus]